MRRHPRIACAVRRSGFGTSISPDRQRDLPCALRQNGRGLPGVLAGMRPLITDSEQLARLDEMEPGEAQAERPQRLARRLAFDGGSRSDAIPS